MQSINSSNLPAVIRSIQVNLASIIRTIQVSTYQLSSVKKEMTSGTVVNKTVQDNLPAVKT